MQLSERQAEQDERLAAAKLIADAIRDVSAMRRQMERELVCGASIACLSVLSALDRNGTSRVSEIAELVDIDLSVASRHTSALEQRGLVVRETAVDDKRAHVVTLTPAGRQTLQDARGWLAGRLESSLASWSLERLHDLAAALTDLRSDLATFLPHEPAEASADGDPPGDPSPTPRPFDR